MKIAKAASWLVTVVVPMLLASKQVACGSPVADPTAPLVRSDAGRQDTRRFREAQAPLRPYRFGDASYLQFREYLQQAGRSCRDNLRGRGARNRWSARQRPPRLAPVAGIRGGDVSAETVPTVLSGPATPQFTVPDVVPAAEYYRMCSASRMAATGMGSVSASKPILRPVFG